jgi:hypothetical protein
VAAGLAIQSIYNIMYRRSIDFPIATVVDAATFDQEK